MDIHDFKYARKKLLSEKRKQYNKNFNEYDNELNHVSNTHDLRVKLIHFNKHAASILAFFDQKGPVNKDDICEFCADAANYAEMIAEMCEHVAVDVCASDPDYQWREFP